MPKLWATVSLCLLAGACAYAQGKMQDQKLLTITGQLLRVAGVGGESTGWAILADSEIQIEGKVEKSIEVDGEAKQFEKLENKRVEAKGNIIVRHGIERGDWPVLKVSSIREIRTKGTESPKK